MFAPAFVLPFCDIAAAFCCVSAEKMCIKGHIVFYDNHTKVRKGKRPVNNSRPQRNGAEEKETETLWH